MFVDGSVKLEFFISLNVCFAWVHYWWFDLFFLFCCLTAPPHKILPFYSAIYSISPAPPLCAARACFRLCQSSGAGPSQLWASLPVLRHPPLWGNLLQAHLFPHPSPSFKRQKRTLSLWVFIKFHSLWSVMLPLPARFWLCQASCSSVESLTSSLGSWMPPWARVWPSSPGPEIMLPWDR